MDPSFVNILSILVVLVVAVSPLAASWRARRDEIERMVREELREQERREQERRRTQPPSRLPMGFVKPGQRSDHHER